MKNIFLSLAFLSVFAACQRTQYASIPAPKFEHFERKIIAPKIATAPAVEVTQPITAEAIVKSEAPAAENSVAEAKATASSETKVAPKLTFKQRILAKVVSRKMQKMDSNAPKSDGKINTVSLISAIAGVAGLLLLIIFPVVSMLFSLVAIILGFVGKSQIKRNNERGMGWAITGIVTGFLAFLIVFLAVAFIIALLSQ